MEIRQNLDISCEPMDIDRSLNSSRSSAVTGSSASSPVLKNKESNSQHVGVIPRFRRKAKTNRTQEVKSKSHVKKFHVDLSILHKKRSKTGKVLKALCFFIALFVAVCYYWMRSSCCDKSVMNSVLGPLGQKLYGQKSAIDLILKSIEDESKCKMIFFYGPTGVGKTYTSHIMLEHMQNYSNIFHFAVSSSETFSMSTVLAELQVCDFLFIVVDDVSLNNKWTKATIKDIVTKSHTLQKDLYLILIFNNEIISDDFKKHIDGEFKEKIQIIYRDIPASKYFIEFEYLNIDILRKCVENALLIRKKKVGQQVVDDVMNHLNVKFDGCKGIDSKINRNYFDD